MTKTRTTDQGGRLGMNVFMLLGLGWALTGCVTEPVQKASPSTNGISPYADVQVYDCGQGIRFTAAYELNQAWLLLPERQVRLTPVESGAGAQYQGEGVTLWNQGEQALLVLPTERYSDCQVDPRATVWAKAKLQGVDFRAVGTEPGWLLEIYEGKRIVLVTDYGRNWHELVAPKPQVDASQGLTRYETYYQNRPVTVDIKQQACTDASGDTLEARVRVQIGSRTYQGCGRSL